MMMMTRNDDDDDDGGADDKLSLMTYYCRTIKPSYSSQLYGHQTSSLPDGMQHDIYSTGQWYLVTCSRMFHPDCC